MRLLPFFLFLSACGGSSPHPTPVSGWNAGPTISGKNYSAGVVTCSEGIFCFEIPEVPNSVHYLTILCSDLSTRRGIRMKYRVDNAQLIVPLSSPASPSMLTLYFQRAGDNWSGKDKYETYRWYAKFATETPIVSGEHSIEVSFDSNWTSVLSSSRETAPVAFADARKQCARVGFVLGGGDGLGHGVFATAKGARIVVTEFTLL